MREGRSKQLIDSGSTKSTCKYILDLLQYQSMATKSEESIRELIDRARETAGQGNESGALMLLHEALMALNQPTSSTTQRLMNEASRLTQSHGSTSGRSHQTTAIANLLARISIGQESEDMDVDSACFLRGQHAGGSRGEQEMDGMERHSSMAADLEPPGPAPNQPLLCETDREGIIGCALADGSSFICPVCHGVFSVARRQRHLLWCDGT